MKCGLNTEMYVSSMLIMFAQGRPIPGTTYILQSRSSCVQGTGQSAKNEVAIWQQCNDFHSGPTSQCILGESPWIEY
jgi:hypothetical protein